MTKTSSTRTRTDLVSRQPRDGNGRWVRSRRTVLVDDSGEMGRSPTSSKAFTMSATVTDCPEELRRIAQSYPTNTKHSKHPGELKFATSLDDIRLGVLNEINLSDPRIHSVILSKNDMPPDAAEYLIFGETMRQVVTDAVSKEDHDYDIVMDSHDKLTSNRGKRICARVAEETGRNVVSCEVVSSAECPEIQAADFVAGAVGAKYNSDQSEFLDILKDKVSIRRMVIEE